MRYLKTYEQLNSDELINGNVYEINDDGNIIDILFIQYIGKYNVEIITIDILDIKNNGFIYPQAGISNEDGNIWCKPNKRKSVYEPKYKSSIEEYILKDLSLIYPILKAFDISVDIIKNSDGSKKIINRIESMPELEYYFQSKELGII
jgi:hypothetical protein